MKTCTMTQSIRTILTPFLIISYVFGSRIANLSSDRSKLWFNLIYMLIIWLIYYFLLMSVVSLIIKVYSVEYHVCHSLEFFTTLLSIIFGIYHDKKFRNCLKRLDIVDDTLIKLGTMTDYKKLRKKTISLILGWFVIVILMNCGTALYVKIEHACGTATAVFFIFILNYSFHINAFGDLITASILEYIGLKFDQVNLLLQNLIKDKQEIKQAWECQMIHPQRRFLKILNDKHIIWIIIHLHLELHKISCEIDSIFGTQTTFKMVCYFTWIAIDLQVLFSAILIENFIEHRIMWAIVHFLWFFHNFSKVLLINYMCETVRNKASVIKDLINRLSYSTYNVEIREIILQVSLRTIYVPLRFCGIGFFQFGFKFLYRFIMSIATVLVIVLQAYANKHPKL